jgi:glyceraldehyde-3-phosphate dehydrogenase (NAD(P))
MIKVRVGVNGYGVIGKRIADAVLRQDDMELVGVTARTPDFRLFPARKKGISIFAVDREAQKKLTSSGFEIQGRLDDLLTKVDVIIDATPAGVGKENKRKYDQVRVKSIFQGGESHELTNFSFVAEINYKDALGKESLRVVSCNTTAICRITHAFIREGVLEKAYIALARRGADPVDAHKKGPLGTVVLEKTIPSHQGPDAKTVIPELDILTAAVAVPTTLGHLHIAFLRLKKELSKAEVVDILTSSPRVVPVAHKDGIIAENQLVELMRDLGRPRADMWEVAFWQDSLFVCGKDASFYYQVHNEAIVIPENIDAIRVLSGIEKDPKASIARTNTSLGIVSNFDTRLTEGV